jgi:hypothetical protein
MLTIPKSSQEMYHTFSDKEVHHSADKGPPIAVFLNQMNPVFDAL